MKLAQLLYGADLPAAAICYVWDNRHAAGHERLESVLAIACAWWCCESGAARAGQWVEESRDVDADFRAAFGATWNGPTPRITGVAIAADTDQTRRER